MILLVSIHTIFGSWSLKITKTVFAPTPANAAGYAA
jgi:hypothetical protein